MEREAHCVQCGEELVYTVNEESIEHAIFVCHRAKCPNFGLMAICIEKMVETSKEDK